jgi:transketolase
MTSIELAWQIRRLALDVTSRSGSSHIGAIYSIADIVAVLYSSVLKYAALEPTSPDRDYLVLSKGHAGLAVYCALALRGFFPVDDLSTYYSNGSRFSGHISHKEIPGVEFSTGSLGHGLAVAVGMSLSLLHDERPNRVFAILGDGECDEGSVWEAALIAGHHRLNGLTVVVDCNKMQAMGDCADVISIEPLEEKWRAFGFATRRIDGHNHKVLEEALRERARSTQPLCVIADTIKGKGVSFMEHNLLWHYRNPTGDAYLSAVAELERHKDAQ